MYWIAVGSLVIIGDIYWLIDGGAKYLGGQAYIFTALGVLIGGSIVAKGVKQMK